MNALIEGLGPDFKVLKRVPEYILTDNDQAVGKFAIVDLETTGLDYKTDKITEIGLIVVSYTKGHSNFMVTNSYQEYNDPGVEISEQITKLTGIDNETVKDKQIDWDKVSELLTGVDFIVCHNAGFDRKFLEQTCIGEDIKSMTFSCSKNDIDWKARDFGSDKLEYINFKLGFFYDAHRAINDCWATLNIIAQNKGALQELIDKQQTEYVVYAQYAAYDKKDLLRNNGFRWNDGTNGDPKAWYKKANNDGEVIRFILDNKCGNPTVVEVPTHHRYSTMAD